MSGWPSARKFKTRFLERGSEVVAEVDALLKSPALEQDQVEVLGRLKDHFHWLAGTGGTFGFARISTLGREAELICVDLINKPHKSPELELAKLVSRCDSIKNELGAHNNG